MGNSISNDELFRVSKDAYKIRNYRFARKGFHKLKSKNPQNRSYHLWLAKTLAHYEEKIGEAEFILFQLRRTSFFSPATIELGHIEATRSNYQMANSYFSELLDNQFSSNRANYEIGKLNEKFRNLEIAREHFSTLLNSSDRHLSLLELIYIEIQEGNYERAYSYYIELANEKNYCCKNTLKKIEDFLKYKLGKLERLSLLDPSYFLRQVSDYNQDTVIANMQDHTQTDDFLSEGSCFLEEIDFKKIFHLASGVVRTTNPDFFDIASKYILRFSSQIGTCYGDKTSAILVSTIPSSPNIISIKPIITGAKAKVLTLNQ